MIPQGFGVKGLGFTGFRGYHKAFYGLKGSCVKDFPGSIEVLVFGARV